MQQYAFCKVCRQGFFYDRENPTGRVRSVCDKCKETRDPELNKARVARHRAKRKPAEKPPFDPPYEIIAPPRSKRPKEQPDANAIRPAPVGGDRRPPITRPSRLKGGLYDNAPEPRRSQSRRKIGLPA